VSPIKQYFYARKTFLIYSWTSGVDILLEKIWVVLTFAGIAQGFFVALLLNNKSVRKSRANIFLSILLIALSFSVAHIIFAGLVFGHLSVKAPGDPTFYLIAPLLWFYTSELTGQEVKRSWSLLFHFAPFFLIIFSSQIFAWMDRIELYNHFLGQHQKLITVFFWLTVVVQFSAYQFFIQKRWRAYQELIQQEVSNTENVNISWVKFFMAVFLLINMFFLFTLFAVIHLDTRMWLSKSVALIFSLSVFALGYKGILQREVFYSGVSKNDTLPTKPAAALIKTDQILIDKLLQYMIDKKPYLDPELTLSQLAKELNVSRSFLSQVINEGVGDNFYNFINKYRVEQVKQLMSDPRVKNFNMLGIALEAGFKSKSTFNLIFKRFTGLTPTEYRKNLFL
jgi:AraC-like DNA-binding protein